MNTGTIVTDLSTGSGWYFGGFLYGLEPLTLPSPGAADDELVHSVSNGRSPQDYEDVCRRILHTEKPGGSTQRIESGEPANELFWFRWITGHQVSFVVWKLMAQTLRDLRAGRLALPAALQSLRHYVHGYTAMLLYTSSCPRQIYQDLIRPSMYLQHRGFSGAWAPDYRPVRDVFRGRRFTGVDGQESQDLSRAVKLCQTVHEGVAAKLVPGGRSLLHKSAASRRTQDVRLPDMQLLGVLFDNYFMTLRGPVSRPDIVAQLLRRLVAVAQDVTMNGLHPSTVPGAQDRPPELRSAEVLDFENGLARINFHVARCASGLTAGREQATGVAGGACPCQRHGMAG